MKLYRRLVSALFFCLVCWYLFLQVLQTNIVNTFQTDLKEQIIQIHSFRKNVSLFYNRDVPIAQSRNNSVLFNHDDPSAKRSLIVNRDAPIINAVTTRTSAVTSLPTEPPEAAPNASLYRKFLPAKPPNTTSYWQTVMPGRLFVYSAYFDPRHDCITVIAVARTRGKGLRVWCALWFENRIDEPEIIKAKVTALPENHGKK